MLYFMLTNPQGSIDSKHTCLIATKEWVADQILELYSPVEITGFIHNDQIENESVFSMCYGGKITKDVKLILSKNWVYWRTYRFEMRVSDWK